MISLLEIAERINRGPKMEERDWDLSLFKKMEELTGKYKLIYAGNGSYVNVDDDIVEILILKPDPDLLGIDSLANWQNEIYLQKNTAEHLF